jgi:hypothetical protein
MGGKAVEVVEGRMAPGKKSVDAAVETATEGRGAA